MRLHSCNVDELHCGKCRPLRMIVVWVVIQRMIVVWVVIQTMDALVLRVLGVSPLLLHLPIGNFNKIRKPRMAWITRIR
jgi:hypothetical protein